MGTAAPTTTTKAPTTTTVAATPTTTVTTTNIVTTVTTTPLVIASKTRDHCTEHAVDCLTFVTDISKEECEEAITKTEYVKALQDALTTELAKVIKTQLNGDYVTKYRPSIWCGSLVMQAVVGETFASQLDKHYASGNALELQVDGKDVPFKDPT